MPSYVRVVHRGRGFNVRVELPDGTTRLVDRRDFDQNWVRVEREEGVAPYVRTRHTSTHSHSSEEIPLEERRYIRILHRGRGFNVRLLLENGETRLIPASELSSWVCVGSSSDSASSYSTRAFVNPINQADRIYESITRRGSRNTTVVLLNGEHVHVPNEYMTTWLRRGSIAYQDWDELNNYPEGRTLEHLTFGIELEFVANPDKCSDFCRAMRETLGEGRFIDLMTYGHSSTTQWVLGIDNSVRSTSSRVNKRGYELTSPILKFDDASKEELAKVLHLITEIFEGSVNRTCGTHIHVGNFVRLHGTTDLRTKTDLFQRNYGHFEANVFDRLVSPSRRGDNNYYCKSCNRDFISTRYHKINTQNVFSEFGTIENRQHQGTLEVKKIWSWMELNGRYICMFYKNPDLFNDYSINLEEFMNLIHLSSETQEFFLAREAELN